MKILRIVIDKSHYLFKHNMTYKIFLKEKDYFNYMHNKSYNDWWLGPTYIVELHFLRGK